MRLMYLCTAVAAVLPVFLGSALAGDGDVYDSSSNPAAIDPFQLKARAVGSPALEARRYEGMQAYHDASPAYHQQQHDQLSPKGWRIISLSVSGEVSDPRYAVVWVKTGGPAWVTIHQASLQQYQAWFDKHAGEGYAATLLSAVGPSDNPIMAAVMEKVNIGYWYVFGSMTASEAESENTKARNNGYYAKTIALYGGAAGNIAGRRYGIIYHQNRNNIGWHVHLNDDESNIGGGTSREESALNYWPSFMTGDQDRTVAGIYTNKPLGNYGIDTNQPPSYGVYANKPPGNYIFSGNDNVQQFQQQFDDKTSRNPAFYPYMIGVNNKGSSAQYWALWTTF